jgi:hypothetical protein
MTDHTMTDFLLPDLDDDSSGFWGGCARGELLVQQCESCGNLQFPPRQMCPRCRSFELGWQPVSGRGTVWSYVVTHPPLLPAYQELAPYNVVVVELDEDPTLRMVGNLVAGVGEPINSVDPATIEIGEAVRVTFDRLTDEVALPRWVRVAAP